MLVEKHALELCLRDAGVRADQCTLVQVGAHLAEEHDIWIGLGVRRIVYIEAIPEIAAQLARRFADEPRVTVIQAVVTSVTGDAVNFRVNSPSYTSSLLELETVTLERYSEIEQGEIIGLTTKSLSDLLDELGLQPHLLVIDVQGAELEVLNGLEHLWEEVKVLMVEYQLAPLYTGSPTRKDLMRAASEQGLKLAAAQDDESGLWGDAVFIRTVAPASRPRRFWHPRRRCDLFEVPYRNAYSQFGEDGILREIFFRLGTGSGLLVEVGAWDGEHLSNCKTFMESGWRGFLIEGDVERAESLRSSNAENPAAISVQSFVGPLHQSLTKVLDGMNCPQQVDLLSVDIDSDDLAVLEDFASARAATVICIEYNPTIPLDLYVRNPPGGATGNSFSLIANRAIELGYDLVAWTKVNQIFVSRSESRLFVSHAWFPPAKAVGHSRTFWGYDGTLHDMNVSPLGEARTSAGVDEVRPLWGQGRFPQPVPPELRVYPPIGSK